MRVFPLITAAATAMALTACASGSNNPFARTLPDETQVIDGPSLALPPSFELRPPRDAKADAATVEAALARTQAQALVTGVSSSAPMADTGDDWLVTKAEEAGGTKANARVREELDAAETQAAAEADARKPAWKRWFGGTKK